MTGAYPNTPRVGVGVAVLKNDQVLLIRRGTPPRVGEWSLPGGKQRLGETVAETAVRETREETGVEIDLCGLVDVIDSITPDADNQIKYHYTLIDFAALWRRGELAPGDDATDATWAPLSSLASFNLWAETARVIEAAKNLIDRQTANKTLDADREPY